MIPWHNIPLARILIPFIAGIYLSVRLESRDFILPWLPWLLVSVVLILLMLPARIIPFRRRWIHGINIMLLFFMMGYETTGLRLSFQYQGHLSDFVVSGKAQELLVCMSNEPILKRGKIQAEARVLSVDGQACHGKIKLDMIPGNFMPEYGEVIYLRAFIRSPDLPRNPYDFDYGKLLYSKGIYHLASVRNAQWGFTGSFDGSLLRRASIQARNFLNQCLADHGLSGDELDITSALLLGANSDFDPELRSIYGKAGVTHILSVSGLHVGLIFVVFSQMLSFIKGSRFRNLFRSFLLILLIWAYAFLTGMSPAVQRAAMMLSLVILSREMRRKPHLLNVLSASALLLLLSDPFLITNLGFQLSYLAVAGIVVLEPPVYELFDFEHPWADKVWKLCSVSIAAQLSTAPLSMVYFHHFPLYFLPANLLIIPLSSLIMYWGLGSLALSAIPLLDKALFYCLAYLVKLMTGMTSFIASLPWSDSGLILVDNYQSTLLYTILLMATAFVVLKRFILLWICLLTVFSLCFYTFLFPLIKPQSSYLLLQNIPGQAALSVLHGNEMTTWYLTHQEQTGPRPTQLDNIILSEKIKNHQQTFLPQAKPGELNQPDSAFLDLLTFDNRRYVILADSSLAYSLKHLNGIHGLIACTSPPPGLDTASLPRGLSLLLIGNTVSKAGNKKWQKIGNQLQIKCFDIKKRGSFVLVSGGTL